IVPSPAPRGSVCGETSSNGCRRTSRRAHCSPGTPRSRSCSAMVDDRVRQIADAVLYEGHMLFPYRLSALKNRQRWTFGGVYPAAYARTTGDRSRVSFDCILEGEAPRCQIEVRFLQ